MYSFCSSLSRYGGTISRKVSQRYLRIVSTYESSRYRGRVYIYNFFFFLLFRDAFRQQRRSVRTIDRLFSKNYVTVDSIRSSLQNARSSTTRLFSFLFFFFFFISPLIPDRSTRTRSVSRNTNDTVLSSMKIVHVGP